MATEIPVWPEPIQHTPGEAPDFIGSFMWSITEAAKSALTPTPTRVVHVNPGGQVPWDECCIGQLACRIINVSPVAGPKPATSLPCGVLYWDVTLALSIVRCVATVDDQGQFPTTSEMNADGLQMLRDLANLQRAVQCHDGVRAMGLWTPLGLRGGCGGGEQVFTARIPVCGCV